MQGAPRVTPHGSAQFHDASRIRFKYVQSTIAENLKELFAILSMMSADFQDQRLVAMHEHRLDPAWGQRLLIDDQFRSILYEHKTEVVGCG